MTFPTIRFKPGVKIQGIRPELLAAWFAVASAYASLGYECIITSVCEGKHTSIVHYVGLATDFRTRHVPHSLHQALRDLIQQHLTSEFDVVLEPTHIHVEFDPR